MYQKSAQYLKQLPHFLGYGTCAPSVLFGFGTNLASYPARSSLIHSYGYASEDNRTDYLAQYPLKSESFMNNPG